MAAALSEEETAESSGDYDEDEANREDGEDGGDDADDSSDLSELDDEDESAASPLADLEGSESSSSAAFATSDTWPTRKAASQAVHDFAAAASPLFSVRICSTNNQRSEITALDER